MPAGPLALWSFYAVAMLVLAVVTAIWGLRAAVFGLLGGLALLLLFWASLAIGAALEDGVGSVQATYTAGFGFAVIVIMLGGIWAMCGAVAAAIGMIAHAWRRNR